MTDKEILSHVDHTLLRADATWPEIKTLCDEAVENGTASVCINPSFVKQAAQYLNKKIKVCTVIGFPLGASTTKAKVCEAVDAVKNGAEELDMVINIGALKDGQYDIVQDDIEQIKKAVGDKVLKVIIETCLLTDAQKAQMCKIVCAAKADYIKTSTGFSSAGASLADIELFSKECAGGCKIKAAGGIKTREDMEKFLALGADRLGTSSAIKILKGSAATGY